MPRWGLTLLLATLVVCGFKIAVGRVYGRVRPIWMWGWPGMDPERFHLAPAAKPGRGAVVAAAIRILFGVGLLCVVLPQIRSDSITAWVGLLGLGLIVHCGAADLLSIYWRHRGFDAQPLFDRPFASRTLGEFWGRRWNRGFSDVSRRWIFAPLRRRIGPQRAMTCVFLASGIGHDLLLSVPAGGGYGRCTAYFMIQALGLWIERRLRSRVLTWLFVLAPLPLLFHETFQDAVLLPFLAALGVHHD